MRSIGVAAVAVVALLVAVADVPEGVDPWQPWATAVAILAAAALASRRVTRPFGVVATLAGSILLAVVAQLTDEPAQMPFGVFLVIAALLADVAFHASLRDSVAVGALAVVAAATAEGLADDRRVGDVVFVLMMWAAAMSVAAAIRWRNVATEARNERIRLLERERIARDLHDTVAHHVSAIAVTAEGARSLVDVDDGAVHRSLGSIHETAATALSEMRQMVAGLRDQVDAAPRLSLADLAGSMHVAGHLDVRMSTTGDLDAVPASIVSAIHRIAQESITNASRHAVDATTIDVEVRVEDGVVVQISDDGSVERSPNRRSVGFGLRGMRERTELLGGTFVAGPNGTAGWRVEARFPSGAVR